MEYEALSPAYQNEALYLLFTPEVKILSDLHLLFLIRSDMQNYGRIAEKLRHYEIDLVPELKG
jgi:hypothetical protein